MIPQEEGGRKQKQQKETKGGTQHHSITRTDQERNICTFEQMYKGLTYWPDLSFHHEPFGIPLPPALCAFWEDILNTGIEDQHRCDWIFGHKNHHYLFNVQDCFFKHFFGKGGI